MGKLVYIPEDIATDGIEFLKQRGYSLRIGTKRDVPTAIEEGKDADAVILRTFEFPAEIIDNLPNVKIIARHGVGVDNIDIPAATKQHMWVTNTPLANASSVAETTICLLLAIAKNLKNDMAQMAAGKFTYKNGQKGIDLEGKTLGIIGYGKIGEMVAKKLSTFGMNILIYTPHPTDSEYGEFVSREELLQNSDFITLHLPANASTKGSFGAPEFAAMKPSAYLLNLARGSIVAEPELIAALGEKQIAGAALDVQSAQPLPLDNPLYQMDNVILTPHIASNTVETMNRMALHAAKEVDRVLSGQKPKWPVNHIDA